MLVKPKDGKKVVCHASAWDFKNRKDFRIKMCTEVNKEDFVVVNHEMGHIQYFLQYKKQSFLFRHGANPGFHEGVANVVSLAVGTLSYFKDLELIGKDVNVTDKETNINSLFTMALHRIAVLPWTYLVDKFRWDVDSGITSIENMNCHWWKLRHEIQGIMPPSKRSYKDFDPGARYHIASDVGCIRYFTALMYQFQFYKALCLVSGKYVPDDPKMPLNRCNFYNSKKAGEKLRKMLKLGSSEPWPVAMKTLTGQSTMSSGALRTYFQPLEEWLIKENEASGVSVGWGDVNMDNICEEYGEDTEDNNNDDSGTNKNIFNFIWIVMALILSCL